MLRFDYPEFDIPAETQSLIRRLFASKGLPAGDPHDRFIMQPRGRQEIMAWADSLWTGVQAVYRFAIHEERKKTMRLRGLANLDQALRTIMEAVRTDDTIQREHKAMEFARMAYQLGVAQVALESAIARPEAHNSQLCSSNAAVPHN